MIPTFEELAADPEIAALLDFEPVPRKSNRGDIWTPELQRELIARIADHGAPQTACEQIPKSYSGVMKLYNSPLGASFRQAWHSAVDLARLRQAEQVPDGPPPMAKPPAIDRRRRAPSPQPLCHEEEGEGQVLNEYGEYEDEDSYRERAEEAKDSISAKLLRCRRLYLASIAREPVKRAAYEILAEHKIDWELAADMRPQLHEPFRRLSMRDPEMILTAENGWMADYVHGPDRRSELLAEMNEWRAGQGLKPIDPDWEEDGE